MNQSFEYISTLEYCLKAARAEISAFKSGKKYLDMKEEIEKLIRYYEGIIKQLKNELAKAHKETVTVRKNWSEIMDDLEKEYSQKESRLYQKIDHLEKRVLVAERQRDGALDKVTAQRHEIYEIQTELEAEKGKNQKLHAQINRDYENSSLPSSLSLNHKKISNSRARTGRKPGGQPGHKGHCRKKHTPTAAPVLLPPPQEILDNPDFKKTKKTIRKQLLNIRLLVEVTEYQADVYYNSKTGERVHAQFPEGVVNDVNYGGSIKTFLFLLNNECCVSIDKCRNFLSELTNKELNISKGMINKLGMEFARKSKQEQKEAFADMLLSPVMHTDCTNARVNGKSAHVFVCATPDGKALYFAREKKGHEGVKGTPVEDYRGILVHDHDKTFYNYGENHQECMAHILRYLKDSIENEPDRSWSKQMHSLLRDMIHYRNSIDTKTECDAIKVKEFEDQYLKILQKAKDEYEYIPPNNYYKEGYNLYIRMEKYMLNHLLFLHDYRVPATNNTSERYLRNYKRKQKQAVSFRSFESIEYLCQSMSMLVMMRQNEKLNLFEEVSEIFG